MASNDIQQELRELKDMVAGIALMVHTIKDSLRTCQSRCHVDNPPGKWRALGRALRAMVVAPTQKNEKSHDKLLDEQTDEPATLAQAR